MYRKLAALCIPILIAVPVISAQATALATPTSQAVTATQDVKAPFSEANPAPTPETSAKEDWTTIELANSGLPLDTFGGVLLSKVDVQGCTRELLRMQWRSLDPIDLYVIRPKGTAKLPIVLFLYNYTYDTDVFREDRWCDVATKNGFAVAGFPTALSWPRLHTPRPMKQWFVSELQEALATSSHDVQMMLNYLESRGDLDTQRVGVFGMGSGGAVAILAAAADSRIAMVDVMDPWGDWPDWLKESKQIPENERSTYLKAEFLDKVSGLDPVNYLPKLQGKALRIQQTSADPVTPAVARDKIANAVPSVDVVARYPDRAAEAKALGADGIVGWLGKQLNPQGTGGGESSTEKSAAQKQP
jgi:hypothetical protein